MDFGFARDVANELVLSKTNKTNENLEIVLSTKDVRVTEHGANRERNFCGVSMNTLNLF